MFGVMLQDVVRGPSCLPRMPDGGRADSYDAVTGSHASMRDMNLAIIPLYMMV